VRRAIIAVIVVAALGVSSCGSDLDDSLGAPKPTYAPNGQTAKVLSLDNNFIPQTVTVAAGTAIEFHNNGRNDHNVVPVDDPKVTTWGVLEAGFHPTDTYTHVFDTPGTYVYYCTIHGTPKAAMFGTITVTAP
jgi:plastocyanin